MENGNFDQDLLTLCINKIKHQMQKKMSQVLKPYGLCSMHSMYLVFLYKEGDMTLMELSRRLHFDRSNTSRVIRSLVQKGYAFCDKQDDLKRKYKVGLTQEGKAVAKDFVNQMEVFRRENNAKLSVEEWTALLTLLKKLAE